ncbi:hypothetical protein HL653_10355 [Sphingomonas sp. AP4-R1]|uniref:MFS transporter n=1 Tax=Sphingomonas sp. AP4-R1 TaxID=2735134 RepID=UPI001493B8D3|nr:MFS transporter [Sphingomonas sp. AP4-R1]QJU58142.1 hypothetical protein HL653_10355 [Sphingomonas sp. AP4-R1]
MPKQGQTQIAAGDIGGNAQEPDHGFQNFTRMQIASVLLVGVMSSLIVVLQPLLLGPLAAEGRLSLREMGQTAMLEAFGMAAAIAIGGAFLPPRHLRTISFSAILLSVGANIVTTLTQHEIILAARFVNGLSVGILLWVWTGLVTRVAMPARLMAIFLALQTSGALLVSWLFSAYLMPRVGASGGYICLAVATGLAGLLTFGGPSEYRAHAGSGSKGLLLPSGRGWIGLLAVLCQMAAIMAFWVYVLPLGRERGLSTNFVAFAVSASLVAQIVGAVCASLVHRLHARTALYGSLAASLCGLALVVFGQGTSAFVAGLIIIVFFWMFAPAYHMPYLIEVDPSRRAGMQMITAQLLGLSAGPAVASFVVLDDNVGPALWVSTALYCASAFFIFVTTASRARARNESHIDRAVRGSS